MLDPAAQEQIAALANTTAKRMNALFVLRDMNNIKMHALIEERSAAQGRPVKLNPNTLSQIKYHRYHFSTTKFIQGAICDVLGVEFDFLFGPEVTAASVAARDAEEAA